MHFIPLVLAVANAWAAGIEDPNHDSNQDDPKIRAIHRDYIQLREFVEKEHPDQYVKLTKIETLLFELNNDLSTITIDNPSKIAKQAYKLLKKLDKVRTKEVNGQEECGGITWRDRIINY